MTAFALTYGGENMPQIIITIVFGFLWWWVYNRVRAGLTYVMILGSVLAVCVCCCKGDEPQWGWWNFNWDNYRACGRCFWQTLELIIALVVIGILVVLYTAGAFPTGVVLTNILLAAIFAPLFVRIICCAWE
jgi:hypothetical protein